MQTATKNSYPKERKKRIEQGRFVSQRRVPYKSRDKYGELYTGNGCVFCDDCFLCPFPDDCKAKDRHITTKGNGSKIIQAHKPHVFTSVEKKKISKASKARWQSPEYKERMSKAMKDSHERRKQEESND